MKKLFRKFWDNVQPVMRHYFTERHKTPMSWFRLRLNYARSVATTSIVGHILGLGDRHTSNILLDNHTGEVVHIDLGIAFDQVRCCSCTNSNWLLIDVVIHRESCCPFQRKFLSDWLAIWLMDSVSPGHREFSRDVPKKLCECSEIDQKLLLQF